MAVNIDKMSAGQAGNLSDLTKIPPHEFEMHFQNWMEQDDVARSLQAKLRKDLIMNFNKTTLGKKLLCQTVGGGANGRGTAFQRLTLSPLILALNTLVAEFLYAQNCHFSLSVFCTEIPFRNTLPDFESMRNFRFCKSEIMDILEAILPSTATKDKPLAIQIIKEYSKNSNMSLLLLMLREIVSRMTTAPMSVVAPTSAVVPPTSPSRGKQSEGKQVKEHQGVQCEAGTNNQDDSLKHLNKYLLMLTKKVGAMIDIFDGGKKVAPSVSAASVRPRLLLTTRARKYDSLNRSLQRVTENLKQLSRAKRKNRNISAIVEAINTLANQFSKCSARLEGEATEPRRPNRRPSRSLRLKKQIAGHPREKSYSEWVYDLRNTTNGQKFLDRVETSVRKTFNKQKEKLRYDMETKLRLHKELLKMHYKQKLTEELSKYESKIFSQEEFLDSSPSQTNNLDQKPISAPLDCRDAVPRKKTPPRMERIDEEELEEFSEKDKRPTYSHAIVQTTSTIPGPTVAQKPPLDTQKEIEQFAKSMIVQERKVDHIVNDAKLRVQQLESESNQIDQSFFNFLERQRMEKELTRETANKLWANYTRERDALCRKYGFGAYDKPQEKMTSLRERDRSPPCPNKECVNVETTTAKPKEAKALPTVGDSDKLEFTNAILEAKEKFFADAAEERRAKERLHRPISSELVSGAKGDGSFNTMVGAYFINENFGVLQSEPNLTQGGGARSLNTAYVPRTQPSSPSTSSASSNSKAFSKRSLFKPTTPLKKFSPTDVAGATGASAQAKGTTGPMDSVETTASAILAKAEAAAESAARTLYKNRNYFEKKAERERAERERALQANVEQDNATQLKENQHKETAQARTRPTRSPAGSGDEYGDKRSSPSLDTVKNGKPCISPRASQVEDSLAKMRRLFQNTDDEESDEAKEQQQLETVGRSSPRVLERLSSNKASPPNEKSGNRESRNSDHSTTRNALAVRTSNDGVSAFGSQFSDPHVFRSTAGEDIPDRSRPQNDKGRNRPMMQSVFNQTYSVESNCECSSFADCSDGSKEDHLTNVNDLLVRYSILRSSLVRPSRSDAATSVNDPTEESQDDYNACGGRSLPYTRTLVVRPIRDECKSAPLTLQSTSSLPKVRVKLERVCQPIAESQDSDRNSGIFHTVTCSKSNSSTSSGSNVPILTGSRSESDSDFWD